MRQTTESEIMLGGSHCSLRLFKLGHPLHTGFKPRSLAWLASSTGQSTTICICFFFVTHVPVYALIGKINFIHSFILVEQSMTVDVPACHYRVDKHGCNILKVIKSSVCVFLSICKVLFWLLHSKIENWANFHYIFRNFCMSCQESKCFNFFICLVFQ